MNETNLTAFYDQLKQNLNNDEAPSSNLMNVKMGTGGFNNSPGAMAWRNKAVHCCDHLKDHCCKHLLLDIYCKILPLDKEFIDGHHGMMKQDIDSMLANKNMTATQYLTSCYESTNAPLLEFLLRSVNNIGKAYMEEADETLKDAQETGEAIPEPEEPSTEDENIETQLVDVTSDTEYENFVDTLKKKTIDKIVDDISKIITNEKEKNDMTFDTTPIADAEEKMESTTSIALNYIQHKLMKENIDITPEMQNDMMAIAIREATLNQMDIVFKQPAGEFREYVSRIHFGKGILINESAVNYFTENFKDLINDTNKEANDIIKSSMDKNKKSFDDMMDDIQKDIDKHQSDTDEWLKNKRSRYGSSKQK